MKWNKFPKTLPPENILVAILMLSKEYYAGEESKSQSILLPSIGKWNYSCGWITYEDKSICLSDIPTYWLKFPDIDPEIFDFYRDKFDVNVVKEFDFK